MKNDTGNKTSNRTSVPAGSLIMRMLLIWMSTVVVTCFSGTAWGYSITDDPAGGDCAAIGTWDSQAKTCTLSADIDEAVTVDSDGITLDGNSHTINGYGVSLSGRTGVAVKNFKLQDCINGIDLTDSNGNTITNNVISTAGNLAGINLLRSNGNTITRNRVTRSRNFGSGIELYYASDNIITLNTFYGNWGSVWGVFAFRNVINNNDLLYASYYAVSTDSNSSENVITNNNISSGYVSAGGDQVYNNNFGASAYIYSGSIFSLPKPIGGNHWANFDSSGEGCFDTDSDGFCDTAFGLDLLPWVKKDGWRLVDAAVDVQPKSLRKSNSAGKRLTAYIELSGHDVNLIDVSTITVSNASGVVLAYAFSSPITIGDYDSDGISDLMVTFDAELVASDVTPGTDIQLVINGYDTDRNFAFEGSSYISVKP